MELTARNLRRRLQRTVALWSFSLSLRSYIEGTPNHLDSRAKEPQARQGAGS